MSKPAVTLRKPKTVDTTTAEAFVSGPQPPPAQSAPAKQQPRPAPRRTRRAIRVEDTTRINAYVPITVSDALDRWCLDNGRKSLSEAVTIAIERLVAPPAAATKVKAKKAPAAE